jgi:hypothetical protein
MKILIIGKLSNIPEKEKHLLFQKAEDLLYNFSWEPMNPIKFLKDDSQSLNKIINSLEDLLLTSEALFMLKNWRDCAGAIILHSLAKHNNKPVYYEEWHTTPFMNKFQKQIKSKQIPI